MIRKISRLLPALLLLGGGCVALSACGGPTRSVASYCSYFYGQGSALRDRWLRADSNASQDPFAGLSTVFSALPEASSFMHELSLRAPETIAPDVNTLADAFKQASEQEASAGSDPLGALAGGLMTGLAASGAEQRFNEYTQQHCGSPPGSTQDAAAPSAEPTSSQGGVQGTVAATAEPTAPSATSSSAQTNTASTAFFAPTGNVTCSIQAESAECSVASANVTFVLPAGGGSAYKIGGLSVPSGQGAEAPYDTEQTSGSIVCDVPPEATPSGVTCRDTASGHGFEASRVPARQGVY